MPLTSSISQLILPKPRTSVVVPVRPPMDFVSGTPGSLIKSHSSGVIEHDAPVSITIGSSLGFEET